MFSLIHASCHCVEQFKGLPMTLKRKNMVSLLDVPLLVPLCQESEKKTRGVWGLISRQFCISYCWCLGQMSQRIQQLDYVIAGSLAIFHMLFRLYNDISGLRCLDPNGVLEQ